MPVHECMFVYEHSSIQYSLLFQCAPVHHVYDQSVCKGLPADECADVILCVKKLKIKVAELHNKTVKSLQLCYMNEEQ